MVLMTKELAKQFPKLYSNEQVPEGDRVVIAKFFHPLVIKHGMQLNTILKSKYSMAMLTLAMMVTVSGETSAWLKWKTLKLRAWGWSKIFTSPHKK